MKSFVLETNGRGLWSREQRKVKITKITFGEYSDELCLHFSKSSWNPDKHGLIYTDPKFIKEFRAMLVKSGVPKKAANDIDYTEQGMQGDDYVSLEFGPRFKSYIFDKALGLE